MFVEGSRFLDGNGSSGIKFFERYSSRTPPPPSAFPRLRLRTPSSETSVARLEPKGGFSPQPTGGMVQGYSVGAADVAVHAKYLWREYRRSRISGYRLP